MNTLNVVARLVKIIILKTISAKFGIIMPADSGINASTAAASPRGIMDNIDFSNGAIVLSVDMSAFTPIILAIMRTKKPTMPLLILLNLTPLY